MCSLNKRKTKEVYLYNSYRNKDVLKEETFKITDMVIT